jgi:ATP-binding cassette, subfamily B (MDR/TAP), member 1
MHKSNGQPASLNCQQLEFAYPSRSNAKVVKGLGLEVDAGNFVALVGPSGCGKSTMVSLIARFYEPTAGVISIDDQPISDIGPRQHRRRIALVQQEPVLYSGSIRDNVAMGIAKSAEATEEKLVEALKAANILDFVHSLPEGLNTSLGTRGTQLSGGQKQRIAISRALIRKPRVLILDEATSALDTESEKIVQAALNKAATGKDRPWTTIAVPHRLSTIKDADEICVLQSGRIVERGDHNALLARQGIYFEMCKGQALDKSTT